MTVAETRISPGPAALMIRAAVWTAIPRMSSWVIWTSPLWTPALISRPSSSAASLMAVAARTARSAESNAASTARGIHDVRDDDRGERRLGRSVELLAIGPHGLEIDRDPRVLADDPGVV